MIGRVMLIDDDPATLHTLVYVLRQEGFDAHGFPNATQARQALQESWDVVVCDHHLPDDTGIDLCQHFQTSSPSTFRILLSGGIEQHLVEQAVRHGTIHRFIAKPWNNAFLKRCVQEGCHQSQLLDTVHRLKNVVRNEHPAIITDSNWIIRMANQRFCEFIGVEESQIFGCNLFAPTLSGTLLSQESDINHRIEANDTWLGDFTFFNQERLAMTTKMAVTTISTEHRICCCLPRTDSSLQQPPGLPESGHDHSQASHAEQLATRLIANRYQGQEMLLLSFSPSEISDASASQACMARIRLAIDTRLVIHPLAPHILALYANQSETRIDWEVQESAILATLQTPLSLYNRIRTVDPDCLRIGVPDSVTELTRILCGRVSTAITHAKPPSVEAQVQAPAANQRSLPVREDTVLPVFNQQNSLIALQAPGLAMESDEHWQRWYSTMSTAWRQHHNTALKILIDCQNSDPRTLVKRLGTLTPEIRQNLWWILEPQAFTKMEPLDGNVILTINPSLEQEANAWTLGELQQQLKTCADRIQGLCLPPRQFSYLKNDTRKGCEVLQKLQQDGLLIWASDIHSTEALAVSHQCGVDWLSGDALSMPLSAAQLSWFAH